MKKVLTMAAVALFMMTSCSDDDSNSTNNPETAILPTKLIETNPDGEVTMTFSYDGTKLTGVNRNDGSNDVFTYTGDLVTELKSYQGDILMYKELFQYNTQNQLVAYYVFDYDSEDYSKYAYVHNSNGTIAYKEYNGSSENPADFTELTAEGVITDTTLTTTYIYGTTTETDVLTYTYDGKNSPMRNITGFDKIGFAGTDGSLKNYFENVVSQSYTTFGGTQPVLERVTTYTYNADNFPLTETEKDTDNNIITDTQYFYE